MVLIVIIYIYIYKITKIPLLNGLTGCYRVSRVHPLPTRKFSCIYRVDPLSTRSNIKDLNSQNFVRVRVVLTGWVEFCHP